MQVTRENLNPCTVKLTVVCDPQEVKEGFDKAFRQLTKKVRVPGFRPGHAPRAMLEGLVPKEELYEAAADGIINSTFRKVVEEQGLELDPGARTNIEDLKLDQEANTAEYVAKVPLPPVVELGDYKGLPAERPAPGVTDDEVEYQIEELRRRKATREAVTDRGAQEGDVAVVNIKPDGHEGEGRNFMTIVGQTFPQLDEALHGMRPEDRKALELTFPENFQEKDWAGQTLHVQAAINSLSAVHTPDLDDEFAQGFQTENLEALRNRVRERFGAAKEQAVREMLHEQLITQLRERSTVQTSDNLWEGVAQRRLQEMAQEQKEKGKTLEQYAQDNGMTGEAFVQAVRDDAKTHVERALLIREVFRAENMQLTNQELNQELHAMAAEHEMEPKELLELLQKNEMLDELHFRAISRKVSDFLLANADVRESTPAA